MAAIKQPLSTTQLVTRIVAQMFFQSSMTFLTLIALQYKIWILGTFFGILTIGYTYTLRLSLNHWRTPK